MKNERKEPIQIPHIRTINNHISYLTPTEHPLSANVVIIEGDAFLWGYDVGNHPAVPEILQKKSKQTGKKNSGDFIPFSSRPYRESVGDFVRSGLPGEKYVSLYKNRNCDRRRYVVSGR